MKVFICILVLSLSSVTASTFSQVRVSIDVKNATLKEVFKEITKLTGYEFVYSNNEIERIGKVSLNVSNKDLKDVLAECLKGTQLWYMIEEQVVVISPKLLQAESKDVNKATIASGRVVGEDKKPIPGVTVLLKGTSTGVTTGVDGVFFIMVPDTTANVEFIFSFVGMKTKTVAYKSRPKTGEWLITMEEDLLEMDEVVVTGYTTLSRRETASAVSQIKADDVMLNSKSSIDQMLIGQIPGMTIVQTSGEPSATPKIRIRGISSITSSKAPVWVLDGVILEDPVNVDYSQINGDDAAYLIGNAIAGINPRDIETITVLKDASATAIYGVQAANGVIVLTTKQGKEGKAQLNYNTSMTLNQRPSYGDFYLMNAAERIQLSQDIIAKSLEYGRVPVSLGYEGLYMDYMNRKISYEDFALGTKRMAKRNTDWYDILFRNVLSHNHTLSINGGSKDTRYYASIGFDQNFGTAEGSVSKRYTTMMKLNSWLNDQVFVGVTLNGNVTENKGFHSSVNPNQYAYETSRTIPCYNEDGSLFYYETRQKGQLASSQAPKEEMLYNIVHELGQTGSAGKVAGITGQVNLQWRIKYGLNMIF
ncbi:SusC/RagA family TonB-linked outer membrane protein [Butyricimonas sp. An62]|uniref:SusC/RagA family TonB-linked outer membrane protein n=1 Tax=Butyricimonas sp. An62 TaxID=1965649 RepID=UPI0023546F3B|nr:SusC/RagA family TonB-linked outer membrane protein [Butyricimonas sp. An62]